jgi:hypothetical protein
VEPVTEAGARVCVVPWHEGTDAQRIRVSRAIFDRVCEFADDDLVVDDLKLEVVTKPGFFGFEWIVSRRLLEGDP